MTERAVPKPSQLALRRIRVVDEILRNLYLNPNHGNKQDPVDELVYIVLSQRTRRAAYERAFEALKQNYPSWELLAVAPPEEIENILRPAGMSRVKAKTLKTILVRLSQDFGRVTLDPVRKWSNDKLFRYLTSLPRVSTKTAFCVMMYSMGRKVFPADANIIRVCHRLGITRFGPSEHKRAQQELSWIFPERLRYSLHVNLLSHGRHICRPIPKCDRCEIRNFCEYFRRSQRKRNGGRRILRVADVFSGAGGMTNGFVRAGFRVAFVADGDPNAIDTLEVNHPSISAERILRGDIRSVPSERFRRLSLRAVDVVVGGPPCQGFSIAGARTRTNVNGCTFKDDPRNELYREFLRVVSVVKPKVVLMENVPGILSARDGLYVEQILEDFAGLNPPYVVRIIVVQASHFGIPQNRRRVFFVGVKGSATAEGFLDAFMGRLETFKSLGVPPVSLWSAIEDLPPIQAGQGSEVVRATPLRGRRTRYRALVCDGSRFVFNHKARRHNPRDLELYGLLKPGEIGWHAIVKYNRPDLMVYRNDMWLDKYRRLREDEPSPTIVAHLARMGNMFIHPRIPRGITVREAARVQSFRDDFIFVGTFGRQFRMIGNAVPPLLSFVIATCLKELLGTEEAPTRSFKPLNQTAS